MHLWRLLLQRHAHCTCIVGAARYFLPCHCIFAPTCVSLQKDPANFILESKPAAVVFENSFSAAGGNGAVVNCIDCASQDGSATIAYLCSVAAQLRGVANVQHHSWWQVRSQDCDTLLGCHLCRTRLAPSPPCLSAFYVLTALSTMGKMQTC